MKQGVWMWLAAALAIVMGTGARAGEETATLAPVVVTALRMETALAGVPGTVHVVGREALQDVAPRTTPDAFRGLPSVMVQKTGYGQGSPYLRGFTGFRTLMMVDGIRLNNSTFRDGPNQYWNTVDPWSVARYEAVMGPASVLYGSDAVGGAVNALSFAPPDWSGQAVWERTLAARVATADESLQARAGVRGRATEQLGFAAGVTWKKFNDVRGGGDVGRQRHTGYDEWDFDLRADYQFASGVTLTLAHQQVAQDDAWRSHSTVYGIDWKGLRAGNDQKRSYDQERALTYLRLADEERAGAVGAYRLTLSRQAQDERLHRLRADGRRDESGVDVTTWGAALELESPSVLGRWVYGVDVAHDEVDSFGRRYKADGSLNKVDAQGPVADDARYDLIGVFVQDTVELFGGAVEVTPGVRYTYAAMDAERVYDPVSGDVGSRSDDWDSVVGSLRLLAPLGAERSHVVYGGLSQGFRAPNLSDLTRLDVARSDEIETPVDNLEPERFVSAELGARYDDGRRSVEIAGYYTWIEDLIVRAPTGEIVDELREVTKKNAGEGYVAGVEVTLGWQVADDWHLRLSGSWMEGKVDAYPTSEPVAVRDYISRLMPLTGQAAVRWQPMGQPFWLEAVVDAAEKATRLSADDKRDGQRIPPGGTPGYAVLTLRGGMTVRDDLRLTVALENVADEDYRIHGSGVNEPGRNLVVQAEWTF
ncbi:MAG: TonB-dependent receptor [Kiritimatiellia bacterium]|jgi:hemoglobin/transferrin/lactoferrin receptor protein|nr:TonB-dependent receptor [Lentisphaerota bacterium]